MSGRLGLGVGAPFMALLLALPGLARAQDACPERLEPDGFRDRLTRASASATSGDVEIGDRLDRLELLAESCVDGPIFAGDLAGLFMAQALWEQSWDGGDPARVQERLDWAAALAGESALRPEHEPLRDAFETALAVASQQGTLELNFNPAPAVLVVDGQVEYDMGPRSVSAGVHLVQWLDDGAWTGQLVQIEAGGTRALTVGEPAAQASTATGPTPGGSMGSIDAGASRPQVVDQWLGGALFLQRYTAQISDGIQVWEAQALAPGGGVEGRYMVLDWLSAGGHATFAPEGDEANPAVLSRFVAEVGVGWGGFFRGDLLLGLAAGARPDASPADDAGSPPAFEESLALGPSVRLRGAAGDSWRLALSAGGALLGPATELAGDLTMSWRPGDLAPVEPLLRVSGGQLTQPGLEGIDDRYRWVGGELGARWAF